MPLKLALFDCDGTLADSEYAIVAAMKQAFALCGRVAPDPAAIRAIIGLSVPIGIARLVPDADAAAQQRLSDSYRDCYFKHRSLAGAAPEPLFAGMIEVLDALTTSGWQLGVATGKSQRGLLRLLDAHGITDRFTTLQTADFHPSKPDPSMATAAMLQASVEPQYCVIIGDTSFDMAMARAAGAHAVGVLWGAHTAQQLRAAGAAAILDAPDQIPAALAARIG